MIGLTKGSPLHYVTKVMGVEESCQYRVKYLRQSKAKEGTFVFPHIEDEGLIGGRRSRVFCCSLSNHRPKDLLIISNLM